MLHPLSLPSSRNKRCPESSTFVFSNLQVRDPRIQEPLRTAWLVFKGSRDTVAKDLQCVVPAAEQGNRNEIIRAWVANGLGLPHTRVFWISPVCCVPTCYLRLSASLSSANYTNRLDQSITVRKCQRITTPCAYTASHGLLIALRQWLLGQDL